MRAPAPLPPPPLCLNPPLVKNFLINSVLLYSVEKMETHNFDFYLTQEKINESRDMGNAWVFPSIFHSMGNCNKTHRMGRTWETNNHTFPIVWVAFSHSIPILWYTSSFGNAWVFPSISHSTGKCNKTHRMGKTWEVGNHTFPIVWVLFPHPILIL